MNPAKEARLHQLARAYDEVFAVAKKEAADAITSGLSDATDKPVELITEILDRLPTIKVGDPGVDLRTISDEMIKETTGLDSHPEGWQYPCNCDTCLSYGE